MQLISHLVGTGLECESRQWKVLWTPTSIASGALGQFEINKWVALTDLSKDRIKITFHSIPTCCRLLLNFRTNTTFATISSWQGRHCNYMLVVMCSDTTLGMRISGIPANLMSFKPFLSISCKICLTYSHACICFSGGGGEHSNITVVHMCNQINAKKKKRRLWKLNVICENHD